VDYGHFDNDAREYVVTRPDTPLPWINYLGSESYFGIHLGTRPVATPSTATHAFDV